VAEHTRRVQFDPDSGDVYRWQQTAREFVLAANYLIDWHDPPRGSRDPAEVPWLHSGSCVPMMVLYARAVENLLKALLVARGESLVANGRLKPQFSHHRLVEYARDVDMEPSPEAEELLRQLSHVMYGGGYPVPRPAGEHPGAWTLEYPADVERIWTLLDQLEGLLRSTGAPCLPAVDLRARYRPPGYDSVRRS
jgi:hypothetical protein